MLVSLSFVVTAGAAVVAAWQIRSWPGAGWPVAVALLVAQTWAALAFALTVGAMRAGRRPERHTANGSRSVATIVCFRGQTRDLLVTSIARASALGEVVVLDARPDDPVVEAPDDLGRDDSGKDESVKKDPAEADDLPGPADPAELCEALGPTGMSLTQVMSTATPSVESSSTSRRRVSWTGRTGCSTRWRRAPRRSGPRVATWPFRVLAEPVARGTSVRCRSDDAAPTRVQAPPL